MEVPEKGKCRKKRRVANAKWRSPKRGRWGSHSLRAPLRSGVRRPGLLRSVAFRKSTPMAIIIFRQSRELLCTLPKALVKWGPRCEALLWQDCKLSVAIRAWTLRSQVLSACRSLQPQLAGQTRTGVIPFPHFSADAHACISPQGSPGTLLL